jgi:hypothetical protein
MQADIIHSKSVALYSGTDLATGLILMSFDWALLLLQKAAGETSKCFSAFAFGYHFVAPFCRVCGESFQWKTAF